MFKLLYSNIFLLITCSFIGQINPSKFVRKNVVNEKIGENYLEIIYSRPCSNGQLVFGDYVPYNKLWITGVNENTTLYFDHDIIIDSIEIKKGKYALFTVPNFDKWEVILYTDTKNWKVPKKIDESKVAIRTFVKPEILNNSTTDFLIKVNKLDDKTGQIEIVWEFTAVALKFDFLDVDASKIEEKVVVANDKDHYSAAQFYYLANSSLPTAIEYIDKALEFKSKESYIYLRLKSLIQSKMGDITAAIITARQSLLEAEAAKNEQYIAENKLSIEEWIKVK